VGDYVVLAGHDGTEFRWCYPSNHDIWPAENLSNVQLTGGEIQGVYGINRLLVFVKTKSIEVYVLVGGTQAFSRQTTITKGCLAPDSLVLVDGSQPYWLGNDHCFYRLKGSTPEPIGMLLTDEIRGLTSPESIYGLYFPNERMVRWVAPHDGRCFSYNYLSDSFQEDALWDGDRWQALPVGCVADMHGKTYVGMTGGRIGTWSKDHLTDDGEVLRCVRRFTTLLSEDGRNARANQLGLRMARGLTNVSEIDNPTVTVRWGFDQGSWAGVEEVALGNLGVTNPYRVWGPLGVGREMTVEVEKAAAAKFNVAAGYVIAQPMGDAQF